MSELKIIVEKLRFTAETRTNEYETLKLEFIKYKSEARTKQLHQEPRKDQ